MRIIIEQAVNGYIITYPDYVVGAEGAEKEISKSIVIEEKENDEYGEQEAFVTLCWQMHELFGIQRDKYKPRQLRIELTGG